MVQNVDFKCTFADAASKNEEGRIHGLIVERGMEGFTTQRNKWSLRASSTEN
jgi:glutaryl-CoA dehydrogenase